MKKAKTYYAIYQTNFVWSNGECYTETHLYNGRLYKSEEHALATVECLRSDGIDGLFVAQIIQ